MKIVEFLRPEMVLDDLKATDKSAALKELCSFLTSVDPSLPPKDKLLRQPKAKVQNRQPANLLNRLQANLLLHRAKPFNQHVPNNLSADHLNERLDLRALIHGGIKEIKSVQPLAAVFDGVGLRREHHVEFEATVGGILDQLGEIVTPSVGGRITFSGAPSAAPAASASGQEEGAGPRHNRG